MTETWLRLLIGGFTILTLVSCTQGSDNSTPTPKSTSPSPLVQPSPKPILLPTSIPNPTDAVNPETPGPVNAPVGIVGSPAPLPLNPKFPPVVQAMADLSKRLSISTDQIELVAMEAVTWSDASLGCPEPGMAYNQVLVEGLLIRLRAGARLYEYHAAESGTLFLCERAP